MLKCELLTYQDDTLAGTLLYIQFFYKYTHPPTDRQPRTSLLDVGLLYGGFQHNQFLYV